MSFFKTDSKETPGGNYDVAVTCGRGHTTYIKRGDRPSDYRCGKNDKDQRCQKEVF